MTDGTIAASLAQRRSLWHMREVIPEAHKRHGISYKHDISVPVSRVPEVLERAEALLDKNVPRLKNVYFWTSGRWQLAFQSASASSDCAESRKSTEGQHCRP